MKIEGLESLAPAPEAEQRATEEEAEHEIIATFPEIAVPVPEQPAWTDKDAAKGPTEYDWVWPVAAALGPAAIWLAGVMAALALFLRLSPSVPDCARFDNEHRPRPIICRPPNR